MTESKNGIGDINSDAVGSGARYNVGKVRYELIPTHLLESTARVFTYGANKYAAWNWVKGMKFSAVIGCMKRHLAAIERGEDYDHESGERHVGHLMCNALMLEQYLNMAEADPEIREQLDDRPTKWFLKNPKAANTKTEEEQILLLAEEMVADDNADDTNFTALKFNL